MKKKFLKNVKENNFKYSQKDILQFLQTNTAVSILIALVILFIAIGNAFVVGALIGGYFGAKKGEKLHEVSSNFSIILGTSIGAILGGITLVLAVKVGSFFHIIGSILGAVVGFVAIVVFSGDLTEKLSHKLMNLSFISGDKNKTKTTNKKKT
jgi:ABC-type multidrug transport system fused ATPase/permease subunit